MCLHYSSLSPCSWWAGVLCWMLQCPDQLLRLANCLVFKHCQSLYCALEVASIQYILIIFRMYSFRALSWGGSCLPQMRLLTWISSLFAGVLEVVFRVLEALAAATSLASARRLGGDEYSARFELAGAIVSQDLWTVNAVDLVGIRSAFQSLEWAICDVEMSCGQAFPSGKKATPGGKSNITIATFSSLQIWNQKSITPDHPRIRNDFKGGGKSNPQKVGVIEIHWAGSQVYDEFRGCGWPGASQGHGVIRLSRSVRFMTRHTLPEINIAPEKIASQTERIILQASIFMGRAVSFRGGILWQGVESRFWLHGKF